MEISVIGRHVSVSPRFHQHLEEKLEKVSQLAPRAQRVEVEISHETNPRQSSTSERIELTVYDNGPVIRAEARSEDRYAAFDIAFGKLIERLRRARDRRKSHGHKHGAAGVRTLTPSEGIPLVPASLVEAARVAEADATGTDAAPEEQALGDVGRDNGESPVVIRRKTHPAKPMTLDDALYEMELVGHDFYLYVDQESGRPNVVYRRRGWNYGVIELDPTAVAV
ncbi:ribosome-associated translation inhibitor RaiA [Micrococcales bacterium 31B]|nr:ribosome-associated translation inhibitor RaiA [Micrococcales bacterium 31B]